MPPAISQKGRSPQRRNKLAIPASSEPVARRTANNPPMMKTKKIISCAPLKPLGMAVRLENGGLAVTECEHDQQADHYLFDEQRMCQTVKLTLDDGKEISRNIEFPKDKPDYGRKKIEKKFHDLSAGVMDTRAC
jgi:hypothetical protein